MGSYINPVDRSKEDWLREHGTEPSRVAPKSINDKPDHLPVVLVDNGPFTAAGIAFSEKELQAFSYPDDSRYKVWFWVEVEKLLNPNVSDLAHYLKV